MNLALLWRPTALSGQGLPPRASTKFLELSQTVAASAPSAHLCATAEREVLWVLNGHCNSPIAGYATINGAEMLLIASVLDEQGCHFIEAKRSGAVDRPRELGRAVAFDLLEKGAADTIARTRPLA